MDHAASGLLIGGYGLKLETGEDIARAVATAEFDGLDAKFVEQYPAVHPEVTLQDDLVDVVGGGWDVVIRLGVVLEPELTARRFARDVGVCCAAPSYLARHGTPRHPLELGQHACLRYANISRDQEWRFTTPDGDLSVPVSGPLTSNDGTMLCALAGFVTAPTTPRIMFARGTVVPSAVQEFAWRVIETRCAYQSYERDQRSFWAYDARAERVGAGVAYSIGVLSELAWKKTEPPAVISMTILDDGRLRLTALRSSYVDCAL